MIGLILTVVLQNSVVMTSGEASDHSVGISWPNIETVSESIDFNIRNGEFIYELPFKDTDGNLQYVLVCVGGSDEILDRLGSQLDVNFVGPLSCRLNFDGHITGFSLLGSDSSPVWHTRSQFHAHELLGRCGDYPEYGRLRNFRLRGFVLTLETENVIASKRFGLESLTLVISVQSDDAARSSRAEPSGVLRPQIGDNCDVVLEGDDPPFCRDTQTFKIEECVDFDLEKKENDTDTHQSLTLTVEDIEQKIN